MKMKSLCLVWVVHLVSFRDRFMCIREKGDSRGESLFSSSSSDRTNFRRIHNKQN